MNPDIHSGAMNTALPTLLPKKSATNSFAGQRFENIAECEDDQQLINAIKQHAQNAGIEYLFEIPGALFAENDPVCCVLRYSGKEIRHGFVLCDRKSGTVELVDFDEIPKHARDFFASFVSVLSRLEALERKARLH